MKWERYKIEMKARLERNWIDFEAEIEQHWSESGAISGEVRNLTPNSIARARDVASSEEKRDAGRQRREMGRSMLVTDRAFKRLALHRVLS
jgi:hypothetical protein